jgi:L-ribulokinase
MTGLKDLSYRPDPENQAVYQELYALYMALHDAFGGVNRAADLAHVMKDLLAIKARQSR